MIVNPASAGGGTEARWARIASDLREHWAAYRVEFTRGVGDGIRLAREAAASGCEFIAACGGDGTINEVANGILQSGERATLGVLPSGTGGDFRRSLDIPANHIEAAKVLRDGRTETIDVGKVTFIGDENTETSRYFVGMASFGLSADVVERVKTRGKNVWLPSKQLGGKVSFALATIESLLNVKHTSVRLQVDDERERELRVLNLNVANGRYFGGGMKIAPAAQLNDGLLDIVAVGDVGAGTVLLNAGRLYGGTHLDLAPVHFTRAKRIKIAPVRTNEPVWLEVDGELPGRLPAMFEIVPRALRVCVPGKTPV